MLDIDKPLPPVLTTKYPKEVIESYYLFRQRVNGSPTGMGFYVTKIDDAQPFTPTTYEVLVSSIPLLLNNEKACCEAIHKIMTNSNFIRWI